MNWKLLRDIWKYMHEVPRIARQLKELRQLGKKAMFLTLLTEVILVIQVLPVKFFCDALVSKQASLKRCLIIAFCAMLIYELGVQVYNRMDLARDTYFHRMRALLWSEAHRKELELSTAWHIAHGTGEKEAIISKNVIKAEELIDRFLFDAAPVTFRVIFTSFAMFFLGWDVLPADDLNFGGIFLDAS